MRVLLGNASAGKHAHQAARAAANHGAHTRAGQRGHEPTGRNHRAHAGDSHGTDARHQAEATADDRAGSSTSANSVAFVVVRGGNRDRIGGGGRVLTALVAADQADFVVPHAGRFKAADGAQCVFVGVVKPGKCTGAHDDFSDVTSERLALFVLI